MVSEVVVTYYDDISSKYNCTSYTEQGGTELNWYEIGRVVAVENGTDFAYIGDMNIWPGIH